MSKNGCLEENDTLWKYKYIVRSANSAVWRQFVGPDHIWQVQHTESTGSAANTGTRLVQLISPFAIFINNGAGRK